MAYKKSSLGQKEAYTLDGSTKAARQSAQDLFSAVDRKFVNVLLIEPPPPPPPRLAEEETLLLLLIRLYSFRGDEVDFLLPASDGLGILEDSVEVPPVCFDERVGERSTIVGVAMLDFD